MKFSIIFGLVGLLLIGIGVFIKQSYKKKLQTYTIETEATVTDMRRTGNGSSPVFEYIHDYQVFRKNSSVSTNPPMYQVGDVIKIRINPENPKQFVPVDDKIGKFASMILFIIGGVFIFSAIILAMGMGISS